jgi:hypothetical protein
LLTAKAKAKLQSEETDHQKHCTDMFRSAALQNVQQRSRNWPDPRFCIQKTINQLLQIEKEVGVLLCTPKISVFQHICCGNLMWSLPTWKWTFPMFHMGTSFRVGNPWLVKKSPNELQPMSKLYVLIACSFKWTNSTRWIEWKIICKAIKFTFSKRDNLIWTLNIHVHQKPCLEISRVAHAM